MVQVHATNPCSRRRVPCSHVCVPTGDSATPTRCLCPAPLLLAGDNSTCSLLGNSSNSNSSSSKSAVVERQMKQLQLSQKKDDLMTVLLIGSIAGSLILLLLVRRLAECYDTRFSRLVLQIVALALRCRRSRSRDLSQDSLDSFEKPPLLLNRALYQPPRRSTFSKCLPPDSDVRNDKI